MDASENFTFLLPPLLHILFCAGALGILAALINNALYYRSTAPPLMPALGRSVFLVIIGSALYSLIAEGFHAPRILIETIFIGLFLSGTFLHERIILKSVKTAYHIYKRHMKALLWHLCLMIFIIFYFILSTSGLLFIFNIIFNPAQSDTLTPAFMITLNVFLIVLLYLTHTRIPVNKDVTKHHMRQSLKIIVWPLLIVLFLLIVPLMIEKYVQSDEYARLLNPPQRLHGI